MVREILYDNTPLPLYRHALNAQMARHRATASNIANAQTEGYVPRRVRFEEQLTEALDRGKRMHHTDRDHLPASGTYKDVVHEVYRDRDAVAFDGSSGLDAEREASILATNQIQYAVTAKRTGRLFMAIRRLSQLK